MFKIKHSEAIPVGLITVHFEKATEDVNLTDLVVDSDSNTKKSIFYMSQWPDIVEKKKVLFIPK